MATSTQHQIDTARGKTPSTQIAHQIPGVCAYHTLKGAPNPFFVEMFAMERRVDIMQYVHAFDGNNNEHRKDPKYVALNPAGGTPYLEFEDGSVLAETVAICNYMDETAPGGPMLTGKNLKDRATISMWLRRIEQHIVLPIYNWTRWGPGKERFKDRGHHGLLGNDQAAAQQIAVAQNQLEWLDGLMVQGQDFICGNQIGYSICDIMLFTKIEFFDARLEGKIKGEWFKNLKWIPGWFEKIRERTAAEVSREWNQTHDYSTRVRLVLNSKLDHVPSQGRVELSQLGASERYTGMAPSKL